MGSKKILEEMFKLVTEKSDEPIEENKFYMSVLSTIKLKTKKEVDAVLTELLLTLRAGNESIGKVSNGTFVCYKDIVQQAEETVIQRFETKESYSEKKENVEEDESHRKIEPEGINDETEKINEFLGNYDMLRESEFSNLLGLIGKMNESQLETFIDNQRSDQKILVDNGIVEQEEVEEDIIMIRLINAQQGNDSILQNIANIMIPIRTGVVDPDEKYLSLLLLKKYINDPNISEAVKKFCTEVGAFEAVKEVEDRDDLKKLTFDENYRKSKMNIYRDTSEFCVESYKKMLFSNWKWTNVTRYIQGDISDQQLFELQGNDFLPDTFYNLSKEQQIQMVREYKREERFMLKSQCREVVKRKRELASETVEDKGQRTTKLRGTSVKRNRRLSKNAVAVRRTSEFGARSNWEKINSSPMYDDIISQRQIGNFELDNYFEQYSVPLTIGAFQKTESPRAEERREKKPTIGKIIVDSAKKISSKFERIKMLIKAQGSKERFEDASTTLSLLVAERAGISIAESFDLLNESKKQNKNEKDVSIGDGILEGP